jgi:hypothetical protein
MFHIERFRFRSKKKEKQRKAQGAQASIGELDNFATDKATEPKIGNYNSSVIVL